MKVVRQESNANANQYRNDQRRCRSVGQRPGNAGKHVGIHEERKRAYPYNTCSEAIQPVYEIHRIHDGHEHEDSYEQ